MLPTTYTIQFYDELENSATSAIPVATLQHRSHATGILRSSEKNHAVADIMMTLVHCSHDSTNQNARFEISRDLAVAWPAQQLITVTW